MLSEGDYNIHKHFRTLSKIISRSLDLALPKFAEDFRGIFECASTIVNSATVNDRSSATTRSRIAGFHFHAIDAKKINKFIQGY